MKKKGFTLIEFIIVVALIVLLAVTLAPRLRDQIAKAEDTKAVAILGSLRTLSESYYAENSKKPFGNSIPMIENDFDEVQMADKEGLDLLIPDLDLESIKHFDKSGVWESGDSYSVAIGGAREKADDDILYSGEVSYTFHAPAGTSADGINLWFTKYTLSPDGLEYDTKGLKWIEY